ncbi:MAG: hypothetical protein WBI82_02965 [Sphaerochaeta sp.]
MRRLLLTDANLKDLCGFGKVPSEATFSRNLKIPSDNIDSDMVLPPTLAERLGEGWFAGVLKSPLENGIFSYYILHTKNCIPPWQKSTDGIRKRGKIKIDNCDCIPYARDIDHTYVIRKTNHGGLR